MQREGTSLDAETGLHADAGLQARLDLAAVYRRLAYHGENDRIFSHAIIRVPAKPRDPIMCHHRITNVGETARAAFSLMKEFVRASQIQLQMEATGAELVDIPVKGV